MPLAAAALSFFYGLRTRNPKPTAAAALFLATIPVRQILHPCATLRCMPLIIILVIVLLLVGGGGYYMGPGVGYYGGGGLSLVLLIVILFLLFGRGNRRL
jgi:hypothetical protein